MLSAVCRIRALLEAEAARVCALRMTHADVKRLGAAIDRIEQAFARHSPRDFIKMTTEIYEVLFACAGKSVAWDVVQSLNARINHLRATTIRLLAATRLRSRRCVASSRPLGGETPKRPIKPAWIMS